MCNSCCSTCHLFLPSLLTMWLATWINNPYPFQTNSYRLSHIAINFANSSNHSFIWTNFCFVCIFMAFLVPKLHSIPRTYKTSLKKNLLVILPLEEKGQYVTNTFTLLVIIWFLQLKFCPLRLM